MAEALWRYRRWRWFSALLALALLLLTLALLPPLLMLAERGVSRASLAWVGHYLGGLPSDPGGWWAVQRQWLAAAMRQGRPPAVLLLPPALALLCLGVGLALNPHSGVSAIHGMARWADSADLRRMRLLRGIVVVLGQWRGRLLKLPETLSVLCIAPPGTGKTAAVVVPSILDGDRVSMVINDVKPELHSITSGHRQSLGPVLRLEWAASDDPACGRHLPRWNPLSPRCLPTGGSDRDLAIDRLAAILIADPPGGSDPHWSRRGRAALAGLTHFIIGKAESGETRGLPPCWHQAEPCFAMLLDWLTESSLAAAAGIEQLRQCDPQAAFAADPIRDLLLAAVAEAQRQGYAHRCVLELTQLASTPDRERGSILSTVDSALAIFKNQAVRQRTSAADFSFAELRGWTDPLSGRCHPMTVYLCVAQQDARSLSVLTALFVESLSAYLISHAPGAPLPDGRRLGALPVLFVLDEFPQMPRLQALIDGPAVGRGQQVSYLLIGQDFAQIEDKYGKTGLETLLSTTAAKVILPLNNETVAKRFSDMIGTYTHQALSTSRTVGLSAQANPFATQVSRSLAAVPLVQPADLMSLPRGQQIVIFQSYANRPLRLVSPVYFRDPRLRRRAYDPRTGRGPPPASDLVA